MEKSYLTTSSFADALKNYTTSLFDQSKEELKEKIQSMFNAMLDTAKERYAKEVMAMEEDEFEKNSRKLLSLTETLAGSFARGAAADPKTASEFRTQFSLMAEPNLRGDYERAVPEFLQEIAGR